MENVNFVDITDLISGIVTTHVIIANTDGSFTSMLKSTYDTLAANSATPQA